MYLFAIEFVNEASKQKKQTSQKSGHDYKIKKARENAVLFTKTNFRVLFSLTKIYFFILGKKAQSMMDLHILDDQPVTSDPPNHQRNPYPQSSSETISAIIPNYRLTNNKNTSQAGMKKFASYDGLNEVGGGSSHIIKNRTGFYAQPVENYGVPIYYGPLDGPDFIIYKKQTEDKLASKNSLDNNSIDDMQK